MRLNHIVNAAENHYSRENIQRFLDLHTKTESRKRLIMEIFCLQNPDEHVS